jgi:hypothetical protein
VSLCRNVNTIRDKNQLYIQGTKSDVFRLFSGKIFKIFTLSLAHIPELMVYKADVLKVCDKIQLKKADYKAGNYLPITYQ